MMTSQTRAVHRHGQQHNLVRTRCRNCRSPIAEHAGTWTHLYGADTDLDAANRQCEYIDVPVRGPGPVATPRADHEHTAALFDAFVEASEAMTAAAAAAYADSCARGEGEAWARMRAAVQTEAEALTALIGVDCTATAS